MDIRVIKKDERNDAVKLILSVFMQFEAPDYSPEGVETFKTTAVYNPEYMDMLTIYGAYIDEDLVGVIATRNGGSHIALFFVDGKYHRQGIGKALFRRVTNDCTADSITVNSSPYAVKIYRRLGFTPTEAEQLSGGMRYTPMLFTK